jgi:hypothetical protein
VVKTGLASTGTTQRVDTETARRGRPRSQRTRAWLLWLCLGWLTAQHAAAQSSTRNIPARRYLLAQPTAYTDVLDAFDGAELPDISVSLLYRRTHSSLNIAREQIDEDARTAGAFRKVARGTQTVHALSLELAAGVFRDLMVWARLPLVLSDKRALSRAPGADGPTSEPVDASLTEEQAASAESLFRHDARSATRSGIPGLDLGIAWGITNQYKTAYLPTWVVMFESRLGFGEVLRPCLTDTCTAGVSRGTLAVALDSRWSYRYGWIEPYLGLHYGLEWATTARPRFVPDGLPDELDTSMPSNTELTLGAALMAWEDRARFQRLSVDVRGQVAWVSAGRDYSPLFDVLGASSSPQLGAAESGPPLAPFYGLTQVDAHAQFRAELALTAQAARYVQFRAGFSLMHMTRHLLTGAPQCADGTSGACGDGRVNPLYRAAIDLPGQRFMMLGNVGYDLFASATGQF